MRRAALLLLVPGLAAADTRIDISPMPELLLLEPAYHLDRGSDAGARTKRGIVSSIGVGDGATHDERGLVGEATVAAGMRTRRHFASASSELVIGADELLRGRHQGYLQLRTDGRNDEIGGVATMGIAIEHGQARALAPAAIGPGHRDHIAAFADELIAIDEDAHDAIWGVLARVEGSGTRWLDSPVLDYAYRGGVAMGLAAAPIDDDETPRGRLEALVTRFEQGHTVRELTAAGSASIADVKTRVVDVMSGANEVTGWIDHELLVALTARFGAKWIEAEANGRTKSSTLFAMQLGLHLKWRDGHDVRELGLGISRDPTASPDGQSILSETATC